METQYQPEFWTVDKNDIYNCLYSLSAGLEYTKELLLDHDTKLGRTTSKNKWWAETIEKDIKLMEKSLINLRKYPIK